MKKIIFLLFIGWATGGAQSNRDSVVFRGGIDALRRGPMSSAFGAQTEYHFLPDAAPKSAWAVSTFRWNLDDCWYVRTIDGAKAIYQRRTNPDTFWHPDMCNAVLDITGDCRDEIVVWDPHEIWIYTQDDNPKQGKLYNPKRNPLYNISNYQATVSIPGWSE